MLDLSTDSVLCAQFYLRLTFVTQLANEFEMDGVVPGLNSFRMRLSEMQVLPTFESPRRMTLKDCMYIKILF